MRKAFFVGGLALLVASGAWAGQRTRSGDMLRSGGAEPGDTGSEAAAMPEVRMIAPGVAQAVVNGVTLTANQDGSIKLEDILVDYSSPEHFLGEMLQASVLSTTGQDGETLFANGVVGYFPEWLGNLPTSPGDYSVEEHKLSVPYSVQQVGGDDVTVFADGAVAVGLDTRNPGMAGRSNIPKSVSGGSTIWADGAIALD